MAVVELGHERARRDPHAARRSPSPTCACGPTSARRTSEHFPSVDAIADAKAEILEGAGADDVLVANAGDARVMARGRALRRPHRDVRPRSARPTCRRRTSNRAASDGMAADVATADGDRPRSRRRSSAAATSPTSSPALAVGLDAGVPLDAMAARAATLTPAVAPRRSARARLRASRVIDDAYNSNPLARRARARRARRRDRRRPARRGARRDARARRRCRGAARRVRPRRRPRRRRRAGRRSAATRPRAPRRRGARTPASPRDAVRHVADQRRSGGRSWPRLVRPGDPCSSRARAASASEARRRSRSTEGAR